MPNLDTDHKQRVRALAEKLICSTDEQAAHLLLDALMTAYVAVAEAHSEYTRAAALVCVSVASRLQETSLTRPQGVPLH